MLAANGAKKIKIEECLLDFGEKKKAQTPEEMLQVFEKGIAQLKAWGM